MDGTEEEQNKPRSETALTPCPCWESILQSEAQLRRHLQKEKRRRREEEREKKMQGIERRRRPVVHCPEAELRVHDLRLGITKLPICLQYSVLRTCTYLQKHL
jgi:hypothetical protein